MEIYEGSSGTDSSNTLTKKDFHIGTICSVAGYRTRCSHGALKQVSHQKHWSRCQRPWLHRRHTKESYFDTHNSKSCELKAISEPYQAGVVEKCLELHDDCGTQAIRKLGEPLLIHAGALTGFWVSVRLVASAAVRAPPKDTEAS